MTIKLIEDLFGQSPFKALREHTRKVHECTALVKPLLDACIAGNREEIHRLQDQVSRIEFEADQIKHEIREHLPRRYFLPVDRSDVERLLHCQDQIADHVQDFAVVLLIRDTRIHPQLIEGFREFAGQVLSVVDLLVSATDEIDNLAEASFGGAEAEAILARLGGLNEGEWMADRLQRKLSMRIYEIEKTLDPITIFFYEKMLRSLSGIANASENTGEILRQMIIKR